MKTFNSMQALAQDWLAQKRPLVKPATYAIYHSHIRTHILPYFGSCQEFTEENVQAFVLRLIDQGMAIKSVKDILVVLKMLGRHAAKQGLMPSPAWDIQFPAWQRADAPQLLPSPAQRVLVKYCRENFSFKNLGILLGLFTGLRIGELCALRWRDFNRADGTLCVHSTIGRDYDGRPVVSTPKTPSSLRTVPIPAGLKTFLSPFARAMEADTFIVSGTTSPVAPRLLRTHFHRLCRSIGIPDIRFHALRHSFASRCIAAGCDVKTVSSLLGHSSVSTTLELYVHPTLEQKRRAVEKSGKLINFK